MSGWKDEESDREETKSMTQSVMNIGGPIRITLPTPPKVAAVKQLVASAEAHGYNLLRLPVKRKPEADEWDKTIGCVCRKSKKRA